MGWTVIKGKYTHGIIELLEEVPDQDNVEVLILFPTLRTSATESSGGWQRIKQRIVEEMPELRQMTDEERKQEFDQISAVIADQMPYQSLEEFERAMRDDEYGLARYYRVQTTDGAVLSGCSVIESKVEKSKVEGQLIERGIYGEN